MGDPGCWNNNEENLRENLKLDHGWSMADSKHTELLGTLPQLALNLSLASESSHSYHEEA
jgi:hypothetical protein